MDKSWRKNKQSMNKYSVVNKSCTSNKNVMNKSKLLSHKQAMFKSWTGHEQVMALHRGLHPLDRAYGPWSPDLTSIVEMQEK